MKISKSPQKSLSDKKDYELLVLENGLKILLVNQGSKSSSNLAAVALCVGSGCFNDPKDVQGLSHFLEHMIFMGSKKYPKENEFDQFVSSHGGFDNAYTECEHTLFHFDIIEEFLEGALDRFAQLFISPIMSIESMEREMEAVESEFQINCTDDEVRANQIFCNMISDDHPTSNFIWGNLETLKKNIEKGKLNRKLHEFRRMNFVADKMFLCVQSSQPIEDQKEMILNYFTDIPRSLTEPKARKLQEKIFKPCFNEKIFFVKSTSNKSKLLMTFALPSIDEETKFLEYLASLIQSEGAGSLSDFLMNESLAVRVRSRVGYQNFEANSFFTLFTIEVNLTTNGLNNLSMVLEALFAFLLLIKETLNDEHKTRYEEFRQIRETLFKYRKEKSSIENVQELAVNMRYFKDEDTIIGNDLCPEFDERAMRRLIEKFNDRKFNLLVLSDNHQKYDKVEKWFGTEYAEVDFPKCFEKLWNERWLKDDLFLSKPNEFICRNFLMVDNAGAFEESFDYPKKIFDRSSCECFYKLDRTFKLPYGFINVFFSSAITDSSVTNLNLTSIFSMCTKNFLSEKLHPATLCGFSFKLNSIDNGLILRLSGFDEKLPLILTIVIETMRNLVNLVDRIVFESFKKELKKNCRNCLNDGSLLNELGVTKQNHRMFYDRLRNVSSLNYSLFKQFCEDFLDSLDLKILIQGNLTEERAIEMVKIVINTLNIQKNSKTSTDIASEVLQIPLGTSCIAIKSFRADFNSVIKNYYQIGMTSIRTEALTELIVHFINEPLFDALRNQAQLGYGIACSMRKNCGAVGVLITVEYQENKNSAEVIETKIKEFIKNFVLKLTQLSGEEFLSGKRSVISLKINTDPELEKEVNRNWEEVKGGENIFNRNELEIFELENINKTDVLEFYKRIFLTSSRQLSVRVIGNGNSPSSLEDFQTKDIVTLRANLIPFI